MSIRSLTRTALLIAVTAVATLAIRLPNPATQGYINLGDAVVLSTALAFGRRTGGLAGGLGSALADLLSGYAIWAPWTLVIKGVEGTVVGIVAAWGQTRLSGWSRIGVLVISLITGSIAMVGGYYLAGRFLFGPVAATTEIPGNIIQVCIGSVVAIPLSTLLKKLFP